MNYAYQQGLRCTFSKGVWAHELVPVQSEVLVLVIVIIQQLP